MIMMICCRLGRVRAWYPLDACPTDRQPLLSLCMPGTYYSSSMRWNMADNIMNPQQESCPSHFTWRWSGGNQSLSNRRCLGPLTPSSPPTLLSNAQRTLTSKLSSPWHSMKGNWLCGWSCFSGPRLLSTTTTKIGAMWPELVLMMLWNLWTSWTAFHSNFLLTWLCDLSATSRTYSDLFHHYTQLFCRTYSSQLLIC